MINKIGVVIVNYHCQDLTCTCLSSLKKLERDDLTYIIVDNSEEPESNHLKRLHPDCIYLRPGTNIGFAGGCNIGIKYAIHSGAEYILLLNPDTRADQDFIAPLVAALKDNPPLGMVGPKIRKDDEKRKVWAAPGKIIWWIGYFQHVSNNRSRLNEGIFPAGFLSAAAMLLRSTAIQQVGFMDEKYFLYFEDSDYAQAFLNAGWGVAYVAKAEIFHAPSTTVGFQSESYVYYFSRNRIWFMKRWARWYHYLIFMFLNSIIKLPGAIIVFGLFRGKPELVRAFFRGYRDGLRGWKTDLTSKDN